MDDIILRFVKQKSMLGISFKILRSIILGQGYQNYLGLCCLKVPRNRYRYFNNSLQFEFKMITKIQLGQT